jgi:drug/metabolite transporter (DMT)-like permease
MHGVVPLSGREFLLYLVALSRDWQLWLAGVGLVLAALAWYAGLSRVPLSLAYPLGALSYPLVFAGTTLLLGEASSWPALVGNLLIVAGVVLAALHH